MATSTSADQPGFNPFDNLSKTFEQFKLPGVDMAAFMEARRKDVDALVQANQQAFEAMQALAHTQTDMLTQAMQGMQASAQGMLADGVGAGAGVAKPGDMARHADAASQAWQKMLADMKQLADMAGKAQADAMAGLTARAAENMAAASSMTRAK